MVVFKCAFLKQFYLLAIFQQGIYIHMYKILFTLIFIELEEILHVNEERASVEDHLFLHSAID
jgi:hypothetical protein